MGHNILSSILLFVMFLSPLVPSAQPLQAVAAEQPVNIQGEIAFVLNGDIWLLDLVSGKSQQLTKDGNNRWPNWSDDGRYLFYTHEESDDRFDLYTWELEGTSEPKLLAKDACCSTWDSQSNTILYISTGNETLAIRSAQEDGTALGTKIESMEYGRSIWPTGNLKVARPDILVPLEVIDNSSTGDLSVYKTIFLANSELKPLSLISTLGCKMVTADIYEESRLAALDFEGNQCNEVAKELGFGETMTGGKGIAIIIDRGAKVEELSGLAYPSFSPDAQWIAAERYLSTDDPEDLTLEGLVIHSLFNSDEQLLVTGASQPAWRPTSPIPSWVVRYAQSGERVIPILPALSWAGKTYQFFALGTIKQKELGASILATANSTRLEQLGINSLIVSDGRNIVSDPELLQQLFLRYAVAYTLYEQPPLETTPDFESELSKVLDNPIFKALAVEQLFRSRRSQISETLRMMLSASGSESQGLDELFDKALQGVETAEQALSAVDAVIANQKIHDLAMIELGHDVAQNYDMLTENSKGNEYHLKLLRIVLKLLFITHLQSERASWLQTYANTFVDGKSSLDRDQLRATADILQEVEQNHKQRFDLARDVIVELGTDSLWDAGGKIVQPVASKLVEVVSEKAGSRIASTTVAASISTGVAGLEISSFLYGIDPLYANFTLARRSDELRQTFAVGRLQLQMQAAENKRNSTTDFVYDGDLAEQFRIAYLLETLAAVQTQHAYANGVAATHQLPNPVELLNWLRGENWQAIVAELHRLADEQESSVLAQFTTPTNLESLLTLAITRIASQFNAPECKESISKQNRDWTTFTNGNRIDDFLLIQDTIWAATNGGGVTCWNVRTGVHRRFTTIDGLTSNRVTSILHSIDGALWFGTYDFGSQDGGVSRLSVDGQWHTFTVADGLVDNGVLSILQSKDGTIWFGTLGGVSRLTTDGQWKTFTMTDGLADNRVCGMMQNVDDSIWFGTLGGNISILSVNERWETLPVVEGLVDNRVCSMLQSVDGSIWFGTLGGVRHLSSDGLWETFTTEDGLADNRVWSILQSEDGTLWFGTLGGGVSSVSRSGYGQWQTFTTKDGLADNHILSSLQSKDGVIWFGSTNGISQLIADNVWKTLITTDVLAGNAVLTIYRDRNDALWFGTDNGISQLTQNGKWTTFTTKDGLSDNLIYSIIQGTDGAIWFGTNNGASQLTQDGTWTTYTTKDGLSDNIVYSILQSIDGTVWFGTDNGVSRLTPDGIWTIFTIKDGLVHPQVHSIAQISDGTIWFGTADGASRFSPNGTWTTFTTENGLAHNGIISVVASSDSSLWFSTYDGLSRFAVDGTWTSYFKGDEQTNWVGRIMQSADSAIWFGTEMGVVRLAPDGTWTTITEKDGLAGNWVISVQEGPDGSFWFGTNVSGLSHYDIAGG